MEVTAKSAISLVLLTMLMALALPKNFCGAMVATLQKNNGTTTHCSGRNDECLIADDGLDLEFMMGVGMSRMLAGDPQYITDATEIASEAALCNRRGERYMTSCTPKENPSKIPEHCIYNDARNRDC